LDKFKSEFFTNISHEIRTPLTLINGYISDLNFETSNHIKTEQNLKKQINNITDLIDSVLDLSKMQSSNFNLQLKTINISSLIRRLSMNFEPLFNQKKIELIFTENATDYFSSIDIVYFEKAISNLILNALKYTHTGKVTITTSKKEDKIIIKISDSGIGISTSELNNIFNRFYQVNNDINNAGGSGVGLSFCKEIIELHNGTIALKSELNQGSEFTITLPFKYNLPTDFQTKKTKTEEINIIKKANIEVLSNSNHNFLVIDDNYDMRKYLVSILKEFNCLEASNGLDALNIIKNKKIDFIIVDYMMPKLNGYEFIVKLNEENNTTPIIMLTANTNINSKLDVLKLGIDDYITKPFNKNELLARINNCINNYSLREKFNKENNIQEQNYQDSFIKELKNYIITNSSNTSLNQDIIAEEFNISKSSFYRKIKSSTGMSPNNFIREIKLQKARDILQGNSNISLKELSFEVGFNHANYFSKIYENRFGTRPLSEIKS